MRQSCTAALRAVLSLAALLALAACQDGMAPQTDGQPCALEFMGSLKLQPSVNHLAIAGLINGKPVRFWLDTGSFSTVLRRDQQARLGLGNSGYGMILGGLGGQQFMEVAKARTIDVGHLHGDSYPVGLAAPPVAKDVDGLIGMDFFSRTDLDLDLPDSTLNLYQPQHDCTHPSVFLHDNLTSVPLLGAQPGRAYGRTSFASQPRISVLINGVQLTAMLDTGAPMNVLFASGAEKLGIGAAQMKSDPFVTASGVGLRPEKTRNHLLPPVTIGTLELDNLHAAVVPDHAKDTDLLLGLDFYRAIHVWISHSSGTLVLQYPPAPSPLNEAALSATPASR